MADKPDELPRWAEELDGTEHNISVPSQGKQDVGWATAEKPPAQTFNWLSNRVYKWLKYLKDAIFVGEDGEPGITVTAGDGDEIGIVALGTGTGAGGSFTGGDGGRGLDAAAGTGSNAAGLHSTGDGTGPGLRGYGGATGTGVVGVGGATDGYGVDGQGDGAGSGVFGTGGPTAGIGVEGEGGTNGRGGQFTGNGTGAGVVGVGGATGVGGQFAAGTAATGGTRQDAARLTNGDLDLSGVTAPDATTSIANRLTPMNLLKAWCLIQVNGTATFTVTTLAAFNITSVARASASTFAVTFGADFASGTFGFLCTCQSHNLGSGADVQIDPSNVTKAAGSLTAGLSSNGTSVGSIDNWGGGTNVATFMLAFYGAQ